MKLLIGIATAESARYASFYDYVHMLRKPEGTLRVSFHTNSGAFNRNLIIEEARDNECSHILFLDDDMAFDDYTLFRLLKHDKDIVSGLYLNRMNPHEPVIFDYADFKRIERHILTNDEHGLIEVQAAGFGFLLVKTLIFDKLTKPYVRMGEYLSDRRLEDISFCIRARQAGFKIYCDLDCAIGHIGQMIVWPQYEKGEWHTGIDTLGRTIVNKPVDRTVVKREYQQDVNGVMITK